MQLRRQAYVISARRGAGAVRAGGGRSWNSCDSVPTEAVEPVVVQLQDERGRWAAAAPAPAAAGRHGRGPGPGGQGGQVGRTWTGTLLSVDENPLG